MPQSDRICLGIITAPHGVKGLVRVKSFTAEPDAIAAYGPLEDEAGRRLALSFIGAAKGVQLARIAGVEDRDAAERLKGVRLYLPRAALPATEDEEYYHADLLGLAAELPDGTRLGEVRAIYGFGAGDSIEIARPGAAPLLVPFTRAAVPVVDLAHGRIVVDPPEGLLQPGGVDEAASQRRAAIRSIKEVGQRNSLEGLDWKSLRDEGRE
jgi:16S rRNA processing protein RimM